MISWNCFQQLRNSFKLDIKLVEELLILNEPN